MKDVRVSTSLRETMNQDLDTTEDIIYAINVEQHAKINEILKLLKIVPRKRQNVNFISISTSIQYFPKHKQRRTK